jgi:putative transposase
MKGKRFSEEQIMRIVHDAAALGHVRDVCRQHHITEQTLYRGRRQLGGREVSEAQRLRALQRAHAARKRLGGALTLEKRRLKGVLGKHWSAWLPSARRPRSWSRRLTSASDAPAASWRSTAPHSVGRQAHGTSARCDRAGRRGRSGSRAWDIGSSPPCGRLHEGGGQRATGRCIRQPEGRHGIKTAHQRRPGGTRPPAPTRAADPHHGWREACVHEETTDGRRRQCLPVLDAYPREGLTISWARSSTAAAVVQGLQRVWGHRGAPGSLQRDNGPACRAQRGPTWLGGQRVAPPVLAPGSPWPHGHNESGHGVGRDGCRQRWRCPAVHEARRMITNGREEEHHERPHGALAGLTPQAWAAQCRPLGLGRAACVALTLTLVALSWA